MFFKHYDLFVFYNKLDSLNKRNIKNEIKNIFTQINK